jgi:hypothetical protein
LADSHSRLLQQHQFLQHFSMGPKVALFPVAPHRPRKGPALSYLQALYTPETLCAPSAPAVQAAARMLLRVADSISSFPKHVVPILTSTVIECHRAGLHASAHKWANVLLQPQHMALVAEPYMKKIEGIAKLPNW